METSHPDSFNDPALKAAVRQAWGAERCPEALRQRITGLIQAERGGMRLAGGPATREVIASRESRWWLGSRTLSGLAAAAIVILGFGVSYKYFTRISPNQTVATTPLPATLASNLVSRHDSCCSAPDHHAIGGDDFQQIASEIEKRLGIPVMARALDKSWSFHGASICPVGDTKSAHLVFARDRQFISLFSLPASVDPAARNQTFNESDQNHPIAGFETSHGFYCVVGSSADGSLTLQAVQDLRDRVRPVVIAADCQFFRFAIVQPR